MKIIRQYPNFDTEQQAIRNQVLQGLRCADCLKPFNGGERKHVRPTSGAVVCRRCRATDHPPDAGGDTTPAAAQ